MKKEIEETWNTFWKEICTHKDGSLDLEQIKRELYDFSFLMAQVPKVYSHITGGRLSKTNYYAETVISEADDYYEQQWQEYLAEEKELWNEERKET